MPITNITGFNGIPVELRRILLDFTLTCLCSKADDYVEFGCKYFTRMDKRHTKSSESPLSTENKTINWSRRVSVFTTGYNPENDDSLSSLGVAKTDEERMKLAAMLREVLVFSSLDSSELDKILDAMDERIVEEGEIIIEQGDMEADNFYVVDFGVYEASIVVESGESKVVRVYKNKGSFGELALLHSVPRAATVRAVTDGKLWFLDQYTFRKIVLKSAYRKRERYESLINKVEFLQTLTHYEKLDLADCLTTMTFSDKDEIFHQGDSAEGMFFIESGSVNCVMHLTGEKQMSVKILEPGDYLGELALLTNSRRALSAFAIGSTKLAFLNKHTFERLLGPCSEVLSRNVQIYKDVMTKIMESET